MKLDNVNGTFSSASGTDTDSKCVISIGDSKVLNKGDKLSISFALHPSDWGQINISNDYSYKNKDGIVVKNNNTIIYGKEP